MTPCNVVTIVHTCLFSMEGSVCKLPEIVELKKKYKVIWVDTV